jgi:hypothetical protein
MALSAQFGRYSSVNQVIALLPSCGASYDCLPRESGLSASAKAKSRKSSTSYALAGAAGGRLPRFSGAG